MRTPLTLAASPRLELERDASIHSLRVLVNMASDSPSQPVNFDFDFDFDLGSHQQRLSLDEPSLENQSQPPTGQEGIVHRPLIKRRSLPSGFSLVSIQQEIDNDNERVADAQSTSPTMPKHGDLIPGKVTRDGDGRIIVMQASYRHFDPSHDENRNSLPRSPAIHSLAGYQKVTSTQKTLQPSPSTRNRHGPGQESIRRKKQNAEVTERIANKTADVLIPEARSITPLSTRINDLQIENEKLKRDLSRERQANTQNRSAADINEIERLEELLQQERKAYELGRSIQARKFQKAEDEIARLSKQLEQVNQTMGLKDDALNTQKAVSRGLEGIIAARDRQIRTRDQMMRTKDQMLTGLRVDKQIAEEDAQRYAEALLRCLNDLRRTRRLLTESQTDVVSLQARVNRLEIQPCNRRAAWERQESHRWSTMQTLVDDSGATNSANDEVESCIICLELMPPNDGIETDNANDEGQMRAVLPCGHAFHAGCVRHWHTKSFNCPHCRQGFEWQLAKRAVTAAGDDDAVQQDSHRDSESDSGPDDDIVSTVQDLDRQAIRDEIMNADVGIYADVLPPPAGFRPQRPAPRVATGVGFTSRFRRQVNGWFRRVTGRA